MPIAEHRATRPAVPQLIKDRRFMRYSTYYLFRNNRAHRSRPQGGAPVAALKCSLKDLPLLLLQGFHGDGLSRAALGAERAANTLLFVLDDGARPAGRKFGGGHTVAVANQGVVALIALHLGQVHQAEAIFRADVHTSGTQDALGSVENGVDLALQAAQPFGAALGLIKTEFHLGDAYAAVGGQHRHLLPRDTQEAARHLPVVENPKAAEHGLAALPVEVDVDAAGRAMPVGHGFHQHARSERHVAAGEDTGSRGHEVLVDFENSARRHLHLFLAAEERKVRLLPDGEDHVVAREHLFLVAECRVETAVFVEDGDAGAHLEAGHHTVGADDLLRSPGVLHGDAFMLGFVHLALPGRHL